jgi:hypothetical protein
MPVRILHECTICGNSYDKEKYEYCTQCDGDENFMDDDKIIEKDRKNYQNKSYILSDIRNKLESIG